MQWNSYNVLLNFVLLEDRNIVKRKAVLGPVDLELVVRYRFDKCFKQLAVQLGVPQELEYLVPLVLVQERLVEEALLQSFSHLQARELEMLVNVANQVDVLLGLEKALDGGEEEYDEDDHGVETE